MDYFQFLSFSIGSFSGFGDLVSFRVFDLNNMKRPITITIAIASQQQQRAETTSDERVLDLFLRYLSGLLLCTVRMCIEAYRLRILYMRL
jgi:hypothetical protein